MRSTAFAALLALARAQIPPPQPPSVVCDAFAAAGAFAPVTIHNSAGLLLQVLPYGGTVQRILVPSATAGLLDVVQGFDDASDYCRNAFALNGEHPYFGALIGRIANRIANCSFTLAGTTYTLPCNEHSGVTGLSDTLHGGPTGFDRRVWSTRAAPDGRSVVLALSSLDGEMGFPSSIALEVNYTMVDAPAGAPSGSLGGWDIVYTSTNTGSVPTLASHTQHTCALLRSRCHAASVPRLSAPTRPSPADWMLSGFAGGESTVLAHTLQMPNAASWQEVDAGLIPTGVVRGVSGADAFMDFRAGKAIGADIVNGSLPDGAVGYDNAFLFGAAPPGNGPFVPQVTVAAAASGLTMTVWTDQPSAQIYSGNFLSGDIPRKAAHGAGVYERYSAVAIETQQRIGAANDAANQPAITLATGETHTHHTAYMFARA